MPGTVLPPRLDPRRPVTVLGWSMQKQRIVHGWEAQDVAQKFGCDKSRVTRCEHGDGTSLGLVLFYEREFKADGLLLSLYYVAETARDQAIQRAGGRRMSQLRLRRKQPGDESTVVRQTLPNGALKKPGEYFNQTYRIRNSGSVPWVGRRLERQGPITGPGLITSPEWILVPDAQPGDEIEISFPLKAPTYDCTSIAYFKMVDADGQLCFPDNYAVGLDVIVMVRGQLPEREAHN